MTGQNVDQGGGGGRPFRQFVLKTHERCNLACDYCYVYTMRDQRWRDRPATLSARVVEATAERISEHVRVHRLDRVEVVLHGGEPLLAGVDGLRHVLGAIGTAVGSPSVAFSVQTNGTLLNHELLDLFHAFDVRVGISLDGTQSAHDRARHGRGASGGGSHARVLGALELLGRPEHRRLFAGLLSLALPDEPPLEVYEALLVHRPPALDLLLPHGNWSVPPPHADGRATRYADWLIVIFDRWFHAPVRETRIRTFEEIINVLLGGHSAVEGIGTSPARTIVIETDGSMEQSDTLSSAYESAAHLGLNVLTDSFDAAMEHPAMVAGRRGPAGIPAACRPCTWSTLCGGGLYAHRYRDGFGFDHSSVYCADLDALFWHIRGALVTALGSDGGDGLVVHTPASVGRPLSAQAADGRLPR